MLQIIGRKDSADYRKAVRYLKERSIPFQEVDTKVYKLSKRELDSIFSSLENAEDVIDKKSSYYIKNGYAWREIDPRSEVEEHQELLVSPILRFNGKLRIGYDEKFLGECRV